MVLKVLSAPSGTQVYATPATVASLSSAVAEVRAGLYYTCALLQAGSVQCWGRGSSGENGQTGEVNVATAIASIGETIPVKLGLQTSSGGITQTYSPTTDCTLVEVIPIASSGGAVARLTSPITVSLAAVFNPLSLTGVSAQLYSDSSCTTVASSLVLPAAAASIPFYVQGVDTTSNLSGNPSTYTVTASASQSSLTASSPLIFNFLEQTP